jgi:Polyketide cyclase / dehydrase and lipid transport
MPASKARWWLTRDSQQIVISASPGRVYGLVADLTRMGEWSPECERVEWADGTAVAAEGARFTGHNRGGPFRLMRWSRRGRVLAADPGREFAFVTEEGGRESTLWRYRFEPVEGGTGSPSPTRCAGSRPGPGSSMSRPTGTASCTRAWATHLSGSRRPPKPRPARPASYDHAAEPASHPAAMTGLTIQRRTNLEGDLR